LFTSAPAPPIGYPVCGSRGPAALIEKLRSDVAPPAYNRSGSGISSELPLPNARSCPYRVLRASTSRFLSNP
jgi:hypothetical protein